MTFIAWRPVLAGGEDVIVDANQVMVVLGSGGDALLRRTVAVVYLVATVKIVWLAA